MTAGNQPSSGGTTSPLSVEQLAIRHLTNWGADARQASMLIAFANDLLRAPAQASPDQRLTEDMTLAHNARKAAIEECARACEARVKDDDSHNAPYNAEDMACAAAIRALSAVTPSPGPRAWTPDQFWEYVGAMAGEFEAGQMRDMMAAKGLSITSTDRGGK